ncbi:MAG TPA: hypothetical protein VLN56_05890, partial [Gammaproteobacteria bacterium]|nr:hypothetical protein [Gammaproteobacteria bacterium]
KLYNKAPKLMEKLYRLILGISIISVCIFFIALIFVWADIEVPGTVFMSSLIVTVCTFVLAKFIKCPKDKSGELLDDDEAGAGP